MFDRVQRFIKDRWVCIDGKRTGIFGYAEITFLYREEV